MIRINLGPLKKFQQKMGRFHDNFEALDRANDERYALRLLEQVKLNASGRPGPNIVTGAYVSAFYIVWEGRKFGVANGSPQTKRLEYGFVGSDSLGRVYNQGPFPHIHPALRQVKTEYRESKKEVVRQAWRAS